MRRFSPLLSTIALVVVLSGCSNSDQPASGTTAAADSSRPSNEAVPPRAKLAEESEAPRVRLNLPGAAPAKEAEEAPSLDLSTGKSTVSETRAPAVGTKTEAPAEKGGTASAQPAEMIVFYPPFYPLSKRMEGIEGRIDLNISISTEGRVTNVEVLSATAPEFRDYAVAAAKDWRFIPARVNGEPVAIQAKIPVPFISEFGSGELSRYSPLAPLTYLDGLYYTFGPDGRRTLANTTVTPLIRITPAFDRPKEESAPLRVVLNFTVTEEGQVKNPEVVESSGTGFDDAALTAVRYWQFVPQIRDGKARASSVKLPIVYGSEKQGEQK